MRLALSSQTIEFVCVVLILCCSSVLILSNLGNQYLWQDEAQTALIAKTILTHGIPLGFDGRNSFSQELGAEYGKNYIYKWHPWFTFYLLAAFFALFGVSTFTARLPFALLGMGTVLVGYYFAKSLWQSRRAGVLAAILLLVTVSFLVLVRQCRYYSPAAFFALLGLFGYYSLVERRKHASAVFALSAILLFHTHYVYYVTLLATAAIHASLVHRDRLRPVLLVSAATVAFNLPWIIWFSSLGQVVWLHGLAAGPAVFILKCYISQVAKHVFPIVLLGLVLLVGGVNWIRHKRIVMADVKVWRNVLLLTLFLVINIAVLSSTAMYPFFRFLAPLIPVCCLIMALILESAMRVHALLALVPLVLLAAARPLPEYVYEITHDYDGPIEGMVKFLRQHAQPDDVVAITYGDMPLKFYTNMRIVGGLTGEDLSEAREADWVIVRKHMPAAQGLAVKDYMLGNVPWDKYEAIKVPYPDIPFENRESPEEHNFMTVTDEYPVVIFRRVAD